MAALYHTRVLLVLVPLWLFYIMLVSSWSLMRILYHTRVGSCGLFSITLMSSTSLMAIRYYTCVL